MITGIRRGVPQVRIRDWARPVGPKGHRNLLDVGEKEKVPTFRIRGTANKHTLVKAVTPEDAVQALRSRRWARSRNALVRGS